jgi:hypothetical protein
MRNMEKFKVGQRWKRRNGSEVEIVNLSGSTLWPVQCDRGQVYTSEGRYAATQGDHPLDLVELAYHAPDATLEDLAAGAPAEETQPAADAWKGDQVIGSGTVYMREPGPSAPDILDAAAGHMRDRAATYDKPEGERSMAATVAAFNAQTGHELSEADGWLLMVNLKIVRDRQRAPHRDSLEDLTAYAALMAEARLK